MVMQSDLLKVIQQINKRTRTQTFFNIFSMLYFFIEIPITGSFLSQSQKYCKQMKRLFLKNLLYSILGELKYIKLREVNTLLYI